MKGNFRSGRVGRSKYHFGSFHLWGDVPALMPLAMGRKNAGGSWLDVSHNKGPRHNAVNDFKNRDDDGYERNHPQAFGWKKPRTSSHSATRKRASAMIAKIPLVLSRHIAAAWYPHPEAVQAS